MTGMRASCSYYGGKGKIAPWIVSLLPRHDVYCEIFSGSAAVFFRKSPCPLETINDKAEGITTFYRVLRDPLQFARFRELVELTPHSRVEFEHCRATWHQETDPVLRAWAWFVMARQAFGGHVTGEGDTVRAGWKQTTQTGSGTIWGKRTDSRTGSTWGYRATNSCGSAGRRILSAVEGLEDVHERLQGVQIECLDWRVALERYGLRGVCVYIDPPYVLETRVGGARYEHEMSRADHAELTACLLASPAMIVLSGYRDEEIHGPLEAAGWERVTRDVPISVARGNRMERRTESVWRNPAALAEQKQPTLYDVAQGERS